MALPTDEEVKEYIDELYDGSITKRNSRDFVTDIIIRYTEWLRERETSEQPHKHLHTGGLPEQSTLCSLCKGSGKYIYPLDRDSILRDCPNCKGIGWIPLGIVRTSDIGKATSEQNPTLGIADMIEEHTKKNMKDICQFAIPQSSDWCECVNHKLKKDETGMGCIVTNQTMYMPTAEEGRKCKFNTDELKNTVKENKGKSCSTCKHGDSSDRTICLIGAGSISCFKRGIYAKWEAKEKVSDPIGDLMWEGEIKMDKPQFTEEQANKLVRFIFKGLSLTLGEHEVMVKVKELKKEGYIIPVKSEEPPLHIGDEVIAGGKKGSDISWIRRRRSRK